MATEKVRFTKEKETLLLTLYARAMQSRSNDPVLVDRAAEDAVGRIDYDFDRIGLSRGAAIGIAIRAKLFDEWTVEFLDGHPDATVLHLACGLDSRVERIDPPATVRWFDLDYPEVVELRRRLFPERESYELIGSSVTEAGWLQRVPADRPVLVVAEGLTMYLTAADGHTLLQRITGHFDRGQLAFDAISRIGAWFGTFNPVIERTKVHFGWGIDDPEELAAFVPRVELMSDLTVADLLRGRDADKLPWATRELGRVFSQLPMVSTMGRMLRYRFGLI